MSVKVTVSCKAVVEYSNPNIVLTDEEYAEYLRRCESVDNESDYFEELALKYCLGREWETGDCEIEPDDVEVIKNDEN